LKNVPLTDLRVEKIPFKIHPRVFAALGSDLVTNDVVAIIELVKNSYDAVASRVDVRFVDPDAGDRFLEVMDDGVGMSRDIIKDAWCVVATPFRQNNPVSSKAEHERRASGNKGLGRLSAARLGASMEMITQSAGDTCWRVFVDWASLSDEADLGGCSVSCQAIRNGPFKISGTRLRIFGLRAEWNESQLADLKDNLSRLVSPFSKARDFKIYLSSPEEAGGPGHPVEIGPPDFLDRPPYAVRGHVTEAGDLRAKYEFNPISGTGHREATVLRKWADIIQAPEVKRKQPPAMYPAGPFDFEIRVWDIGADDTKEIAEHFDVAKGNVRKAIRAHKGISVYRDGILVLPKSEDSRDWLGLDARRISRVGTRLSTNQSVGYVSISAKRNPKIEDTSNREGLVQNDAVRAFQEVLREVVTILEIERDVDRMKPGREVKLEALLDGVSARELVEEVEAIAEENGAASEALYRVREFSSRLDLVREELRKRFVYYSRLATVGTIAEMLVHEIRNRTTAIARFLRAAGISLAAESPELEKMLNAATGAVDSLEKLAETFAPLANRSFRRGRRDSSVEESARRCLTLVQNELDRAKIEVTCPKGETRVAVDPGELDAVMLNLLQNAIYWIPRGTGQRRLVIAVRSISKGERVKVSIHDSGSGVPAEERERIFLPGVTRKPGGIGMGLTVASEIVSEYGGHLALVEPAKFSGATFEFDLPVKAR
jgi:signal transduction histidine kinase